MARPKHKNEVLSTDTATFHYRRMLHFPRLDRQFSFRTIQQTKALYTIFHCPHLSFADMLAAHLGPIVPVLVLALVLALVPALAPAVA